MRITRRLVGLLPTLLWAVLAACSGEMEVVSDPLQPQGGPNDAELAHAQIAEELAAAGVALVPDEIPEDFPRYPELSLSKLDNETYDQGLVAHFTSNGSVEEVAAFYERSFPENGWHVSVSRRLPDRHVFFADKAGLEMNLDLIDGPPTSVELTLYSLEAGDAGDAPP